MSSPGSSPLVQVDELAEALAGTRPPLLLDVRWRLGGPPGRTLYDQGHLPDAVFVDLDRDLAGPPGASGRHPLPPAPAFQSAMRRLSVRSAGPVVVYDDADATAAARAWWLLRYHGHPDVRVLDGGLRAWGHAGRPVSTGAPPVAPGDFVARPGALPLLHADGAAHVARAGVLLDARAAARYRGEVEPVDPVAGHIPGARSAPTAANVGADGRFVSPEALRGRFVGLGVQASRPVGAYCGSGVTAAHQILALEVAGIDAGLYVGSWSDWITDATRPVATGP